MKNKNLLFGALLVSIMLTPALRGMGILKSHYSKAKADLLSEPYKLSKTFSRLFLNGSLPIEMGSTWKYNDNGEDLGGTGWKGLDYDDSSWSEGAAILGYGDGIESTLLSYGDDEDNKYPTYYFRKTITVENASDFDGLKFDIVKDDGAVIYVNGTEAFRINMEEGEVNFEDYSAGTVSGSAEDEINTVETENLLEEGENVIAVELHQRSASSSDIRFDMAVMGTVQQPDLPPMDTVSYPVAKDSRWYYLDDGSNLDNADWNEQSFDASESGWAQGQGPLGYGDPLNTVISYGPDENNKYITSYFVKDIEVSTAELTDMVRFGLKRDDGAVVYVNGNEVFRDNMPESGFTFETEAAESVNDADEQRYFINEVPKSVFNEGVNRIAVEVHNQSGSSSDITFDMYIKNILDPFECEEGHIGCFTSIVPTSQTDNLILSQDHNFQLIFKQGENYTKGEGIVPGNNDFTAYVPKDGSSTLGHLSVNHENGPGGVSIVDLHLNDTTNLWKVDTTQAVDLYNDVLVTTKRNCSGGITPWNTVVTAEESTNANDDNGDGYKDIGWLVEIDPEAAAVRDYGNGQEKLWQMGRMNHENVVITQDSTTAYYGEDGGTDCVYKYVMDTPGDLTSGTVYVLSLDSPLQNDEPTTSTAQWIQVPNQTQEEQNNLRNTAAALGGTNFNGVEDCDISPIDGKIYFTAKGRGHTYRFEDAGESIVGFETFLGGMSYPIPTENGVVNEDWGYGNDNLTFDNKGNLWVLQDGGNNYIWVVRPDHTQSNPHVELYASMPSGSEPTGLTFSPDYKYGFFSVQHPSGNNSPQTDASGEEVTFDQSATVVIALQQNFGMKAPQADFTVDEVEINQGETVQFTDVSTNYPSNWEWTFEGGTPSTSNERNPSVTYEESGEFNVSLTTSNEAGMSEVTKEQYILVGALGVEDKELNESLTFYPNPTQGALNIEVNQKAGQDIHLRVVDLLGRVVVDRDAGVTVAGQQKLQLNLDDKIQGGQMFIVEIQVGSSKSQFKVLKSK